MKACNHASRCHSLAAYPRACLLTLTSAVFLYSSPMTVFCAMEPLHHQERNSSQCWRRHVDIKQTFQQAGKL